MIPFWLFTFFAEVLTSLFTFQGNVVLPDYNIAEKANGVRKGVVEEFDVLVNGSTLEIHLYWTGKGTTAIPDRGVYGPLISAISVTPSKNCHNLLFVPTSFQLLLNFETDFLSLQILMLVQGGYLPGLLLESSSLRFLPCC